MQLNVIGPVAPLVRGSSTRTAISTLSGDPIGLTNKMLHPYISVLDSDSCPAEMCLDMTPALHAPSVLESGVHPQTSPI